MFVVFFVYFWGYRYYIVDSFCENGFLKSISHQRRYRQ